MLTQIMKHINTNNETHKHKYALFTFAGLDYQTSTKYKYNSLPWIELSITALQHKNLLQITLLWDIYTLDKKIYQIEVYDGKHE